MQTERGGTLFLHVGPHKTGSTAIQATLRSVAPALARRGVDIARIGCDVNASSLVGRLPNVAQPFAMHDRDLVDEALKAAKVTLESRDLVVSGEALSWLTSAGYGALTELLSPARVSVLFGVRDFKSLAFSIWSETLRAGSTIGFSDWLRQLAEDESERARVLPSRKLSQLAASQDLHDVHLFSAVAANGAYVDPVRLLETWIQLPRGTLGGAPDFAVEDMRPRLTDDQIAYQVMFNHVVAASGQATVEAQAERFSSEMQTNLQALQENLLFVAPDVEVLLSRIAALEAEAVTASGFAFLETESRSGPQARTNTQGWLAPPDELLGGDGFKPLSYLPIYEEYLAPFRGREFAMLEIGVHRGDSLAMFAAAFPRATVVGIDLSDPDRNAFPPNVRFFRGRQEDSDLLDQVRKECAPGGFDVVIDDASHVGALSAASLSIIFGRHLKSGGLYFLEDWGTGYWADWSDGEAPNDEFSLDLRRDAAGHDVGMVRLVKRLIDHVAGRDMPEAFLEHRLPIRWLHASRGIVVLKRF
jgi:hypothetical protein